MQRLPLRRATPADANAVRNLTRAAYAAWVPLIGRKPRPMTAHYDQAVTDHIIDLYEDDGHLVALIEVIPSVNHLLIENIAVRPDHQGKGIGDLLLKHAEYIALSLQLVELQLYTNAAFVSNIGFYAKRGYHEFMREPLEDGGELIYMRITVEP